MTIIAVDTILEMIRTLLFFLSLIMLILVASDLVSDLAINWIYKYSNEVYKRAILIAVLIFLIGACLNVIERLL
jgi:hypothetical protein